MDMCVCVCVCVCNGILYNRKTTFFAKGHTFHLDYSNDLLAGSRTIRPIPQKYNASHKYTKYPLMDGGVKKAWCVCVCVCVCVY